MGPLPAGTGSHSPGGAGPAGQRAKAPAYKVQVSCSASSALQSNGPAFSWYLLPSSTCVEADRSGPPSQRRADRLWAAEAVAEELRAADGSSGGGSGEGSGGEETGTDGDQ